MDNQMSRKQRAIALVIFIAVWLVVQVVAVPHRSRERMFSSVTLLPALLAIFFPAGRKWRWFLYGVAAGMFSAGLIFHFFFPNGGAF
jgi:cell division protein FtsW (lipid II flippase)